MAETIATNRRAYFDYEILATYEAGIELKGFEVKAAKNSRINLTGGYVVIRGNEAWLINVDIPPYQPANTPPDYDPTRSRRLLLHADEIRELIGKTHEKGLTLMPLKVYSKNRRVKLLIGLGRGKKRADKREAIKKRGIEREMRNALLRSSRR